MPGNAGARGRDDPVGATGGDARVQRDRGGGGVLRRQRELDVVRVDEDHEVVAAVRQTGQVAEGAAVVAHLVTGGEAVPRDGQRVAAHRHGVEGLRRPAVLIESVGVGNALGERLRLRDVAEADGPAARSRGELDRVRVDDDHVVGPAVDEPRQRRVAARVVDHLVVVGEPVAGDGDRVAAHRRRVERPREPVDLDGLRVQDALDQPLRARPAERDRLQLGLELERRRRHDVDVVDAAVLEAADRGAATGVVDDLVAVAEPVRVAELDRVACDGVLGLEARLVDGDGEGAGGGGDVAGQATRVDGGAGAHEGLRRLGDDRDRRRGPHARRAGDRDVAGDHVEIHRLGGGDLHAAVGVDGCIVVDVRPRGDADDRDAGVHGHRGAAAAADAGGDGEDLLAGGGGDRHVAARRQVGQRTDPGLRVLADHRDVDAEADAGGAADGQRAGDAGRPSWCRTPSRRCPATRSRRRCRR